MAVAFVIAKATGFQVIKEHLFRRNEFGIEESKIESYLGTPVFDQVKIAGGSYIDAEDPKKPVIPYESLTLQTVLLEVIQSKNIVTTAVQGRSGTIKEYVSDGDYSITMTGGVVGEMDDAGKIQDLGNFYPVVDTKLLIEICKVPRALTITSEFLQLFGINEVVITDYTLNQPESVRNIQPFQISMLSDVPIELNELEVL